MSTASFVSAMEISCVLWRSNVYNGTAKPQDCTFSENRTGYRSDQRDRTHRPNQVYVNYDGSARARLALSDGQECFVLGCAKFMHRSCQLIRYPVQEIPLSDIGPFPNNLAILGGPSKALNKIVILPFSRK